MAAPTRSLQRARLNYSPLQMAPSGCGTQLWPKEHFKSIDKPLEGHVFWILPE